MRQVNVNTPHVMHETIEGEVIAIHLVSGNYYSLQGTAADIWRAVIEDGATVEHAAEALASLHDESRARIDSEIERFIANLQEEGLVRVVESKVDAPPHAPPDAGQVGAPFESPRLEKYTDMQDLVLLDPVHEVGDSGWPAPRGDLG